MAVTLRDIYEIQSEGLKTINGSLLEINTKLDKMDVRVGALENWKSNLMGRLATAGTLLMFVVGLLSDWIGQKLGINK